jgi:hypothetical protein
MPQIIDEETGVLYTLPPVPAYIRCQSLDVMIERGWEPGGGFEEALCEAIDRRAVVVWILRQQMTAKQRRAIEGILRGENLCELSTRDGRGQSYYKGILQGFIRRIKTKAKGKGK